MIVSIHQPNFFPWLGFFNKLYHCDNFVFLTESIRSKNDKYLTRTKIISHSSPRYLSIPLGIKQIRINQLKMPENDHWKKKALNIIHDSYKSSKYYEEVIPSINNLIMYESENFSDYSINIINFFVNQLNINTSINIDTDFNKSFGFSNKRNIAICTELNATEYLSGIGAKSYNDSIMYENSNIELIYQNFLHPQYPQNTNDFIFGMSIMDVVFNCGFAKTEKMLKI
jgi:hypothetical protein